MTTSCGVRELQQSEVRPSFIRFAIVAALVSVFWVVPSVSSRGESALGDRFVHVDEALLGDSAASHLALRRADQVAIRAVAGL